MAARKQNEHRYDHWIDLPDGGRRYGYDVPGDETGFARYIKIVDADENTVSFTQEVYDSSGQLIEVHPKYPRDTGHQEIKPRED